MNTIYLKDILKLTGEELQRARIELNQTAGRGGEWFIDRWLKTDRQLRCDGRAECSYWGWYGSKRNFYPGDIVFSFVRTDGDEWLFVSAARITDVPDNSRAEYEVLDAYKGFFGRLTILYHKGQKFGRYVFRMKDIANKAVVKEISPDMYDGKKVLRLRQRSLVIFRSGNHSSSSSRRLGECARESKSRLPHNRLRERETLCRQRHRRFGNVACAVGKLREKRARRQRRA